jgi:hypothetical protein
MAGLVPAVHVLATSKKRRHALDKPGYDECQTCSLASELLPNDFVPAE